MWNLVYTVKERESHAAVCRAAPATWSATWWRPHPACRARAVASRVQHRQCLQVSDYKPERPDPLP